MYTSVIDRKFEDEHGVYLHQVYKRTMLNTRIKKVSKKESNKIDCF